MKAIVNEPSAEYRAENWKDTRFDTSYSNPPLDFEDGLRLYSLPALITNLGAVKSYQQNKVKLSSLIGKLSKTGAEEMLQQIKELRKEWERDI